MKRFALPACYAVLFLLFLAPHCFGQQKVTEHTYKNGLKLIVSEDHKAPLAVFQVWYRVGSRNEDSAYAGISHMLEHMMFKGTKKYGPSEFARIIQREGGTPNAYTSMDHTTYFEILASDRLPVAAQLEADRMQNLLLDPGQFASERDVVREERRMRFDDDPQTALYEEVIAAAFTAHPYHWPVIGWASTIDDYSVQALRKHYEEYYSPDNAFIIIAGDVTPETAIEMIGRYFGDIKPRPRFTRPIPYEPAQHGERRVYLKKEAELPFLLSVYHVPDLPDADSYALEVLSSILSSGKSSRLYSSLVYEKHIALEAFAGYTPTDLSPFVFSTGGTPAAGHTAGELEAAINAEIDKLKAAQPGDFELQKAKNQIEASFIMGQDSLSFQAQILGNFELLGDWRLKDAYLQGIGNVTAADVSRVAEKYLTPDNSTVGVLIPVKHAPEKQDPKKGQQDENSH